MQRGRYKMIPTFKTKSWFFDKINKIDKTLARLIKKKGEDSDQQNYK